MDDGEGLGDRAAMQWSRVSVVVYEVARDALRAWRTARVRAEVLRAEVRGAVRRAVRDAAVAASDQN